MYRRERLIWRIIDDISWFGGISTSYEKGWFGGECINGKGSFGDVPTEKVDLAVYQQKTVDLAVNLRERLIWRYIYRKGWFGGVSIYMKKVDLATVSSEKVDLATVSTEKVDLAVFQRN